MPQYPPQTSTLGRIGRVDDMRWLSCHNSSSSVTIPGFSVAQVSSVEQLRGATVLVVKQVADLNGPFVIIGPQSILPQTNAQAGYGKCTLDFPVEALLNKATAGVPNPSDKCGPVVGQWWLDAAGSGYTILGTPNATRAYVTAVPSFPTIGKAKANIPMRTSGQCDLWTGTPGSEVNANLSPAPYFFNQTGQTITNGKWVVIIGQYIIQAINPARTVFGTCGSSFVKGGSTTITVKSYYDGDNPGATFTGYAANTIGSQTVASGKTCQCSWNDVDQRYMIISAECP